MHGDDDLMGVEDLVAGLDSEVTILHVVEEPVWSVCC